jgi:hypothetical protein
VDDDPIVVFIIMVLALFAVFAVAGIVAVIGLVVGVGCVLYWLARRLGAFWSVVLALVLLVALGTGLAVASIADSVKAWLGVASLDPVAYLVLYCVVLAAVIAIACLVFALSLAAVRLLRETGGRLALKFFEYRADRARRRAEAEMNSAAETIRRNYAQYTEEVVADFKEYKREMRSQANV